MAYQSWTETWYAVEGGYVYSVFVFVLRADETSPSVRGGNRLIGVNRASQILRAFVGEQLVYSAGVTTGKPGYETPAGCGRRTAVSAWASTTLNGSGSPPSAACASIYADAVRETGVAPYESGPPIHRKYGSRLGKNSPAWNRNSRPTSSLNTAAKTPAAT